jgi:alanine-glyoxylate transaminase/(R)-3-amino-2-methylpropionate-pyruvate transaminase
MKEFIQRVIPMVKNAGGLLLSDEVQTAFGRMGSHYWGCEMLDYKPDIMTMAKHIGNGIPLACVATTKEIASSYKKSTFTTYGSNPIAMAAGREILKIIDEEDLQEKTRVKTEYMHAGFKYLEDKYEVVGDVRGHGCMLGIELVKDKESKLPNPELFDDVWEKTKNYGLLMGKGGRFGSVFRIQPPMCFTKEDIDFAIDTVDRSI